MYINVKIMRSEVESAKCWGNLIIIVNLNYIPTKNIFFAWNKC